MRPRTSGVALGLGHSCRDSHLSSITLCYDMAKLLIWDLDDTLWAGTLAEGDRPVLHASRVSAIRDLNQHGVVSAICSKNDFAQAKAELEGHGLWEEFVFPEIAFDPKGPMVERIIRDMQLRAPDVVFIDDNPMNLREVEHANPGIRVIDANGEEVDLFLAELLQKHADVHKSRIEEYRILERKRADRQASASGNEEFLATCDIAVALVRRTDNLAYAARIEELINRTNQLNFTKSRVTEGAIPEYVIDVAHNETYSVFVWDRYGYYGLVGFAAVERKTVLRHFLFSCRTMNMGVEQAVASVLKKTFKSIALPVSTDRPKWIRFVQPESEEFQKILAEEERKASMHPRIRIMANCQSGAIAHYMGLEGIEFDNWPRVFKLEDALGGEFSGNFPPLVIYGAFNDYDTRYWSSPPDDATYMQAAERLVAHCAALDSVLVAVLPPEKFSGERKSEGVTQARFAALNRIWRGLASDFGHVKLIQLGHGDMAMAAVADPRHYDRTTLMGIAAQAVAINESFRTPIA